MFTIQEPQLKAESTTELENQGVATSNEMTKVMITDVAENRGRADRELYNAWIGQTAATFQSYLQLLSKYHAS